MGSSVLSELKCYNFVLGKRAMNIDSLRWGVIADKSNASGICVLSAA